MKMFTIFEEAAANDQYFVCLEFVTKRHKARKGKQYFSFTKNMLTENVKFVTD